jgi:signal transduction histidine kinase
MRSPGFHTRLLLAAFLIIGATASTLGFIGGRMFHEFVQHRFEERFQFLARYLALNAELGILLDQTAMLEQLARNLLSERDAARVMIYNADGKNLAEAAKEVSGPYSEVRAPVRMKMMSDETLAFSGEPSPLVPNPSVIGEVRLVYSTSQINRLLGSITVRFVLLSAGLAALGLILFYFISRSLVLPLMRLADTARKVGEGERYLRMQPGALPETREVSHAFNAMLDSLERSRQAVEAANQEMARQNLLAEMGKFSLMIAHEIKNPLGIIKSSFDVMRKDPTDPTNEVLIGYIEEEIQRMNLLIEGFLSFAKPAKPSFRVIDANQMLRECLERFGRRKEAARTVLLDEIPETSCLSYMDPDLCRRAIDNILKNATEASPEGGQITVRADCRENEWEVSISDKGVGIPDDMIDKIFDPFVTTRSKGTGLGLAYCAQVVQAHGGSICAMNCEEKGARFVIELPREPKSLDFQKLENL